MVEYSNLPTLDFEYMEIKEERSNSKLYIYLTLYVDKKFKQ